MPSFFGEGRLAYEMHPVRLCPDDLLHQARDVVAHLAEIDHRYETKVRQAFEPKHRDRSAALRERLERRHHRERQRFEQQFSAIHKRITDAILTDLRSCQG